MVSMFIQNFHLRRYIVVYIPEGIRSEIMLYGSANMTSYTQNFPPYIRQYTSPNENFEYSYPLTVITVISHCVIRKPTSCICENKAANQLHENRAAADQQFCFHYIHR